MKLNPNLTSNRKSIQNGFSSVQFSHSVVSDSLQPHGLQHARPPCPSTNSQSLLKLMCIKSVMPSNHLVFYRPLLLLPSVEAKERTGFGKKAFGAESQFEAWPNSSLGAQLRESCLPASKLSLRAQTWELEGPACRAPSIRPQSSPSSRESLRSLKAHSLFFHGKTQEMRLRGRQGPDTPTAMQRP